MRSRLLLASAVLLAGTTFAFGADKPAPAPAQAPKLQTRCYQVADLVVPIASGAKDDSAKPTREDRLIRLITSSVRPESWQAMGGEGTTDYFPLTMTLVVNQTPDVQDQVSGLLDALRRPQDVQVALEVRVITTTRDTMERIGIDFEAKWQPCEAAKCEAAKCDAARVSFLNDRQVFLLMEALQGDPRTNVMQAPKVTTLHGQQAVVDTTKQTSYVTGVGFETVEKNVSVVPKNESKTTGIHMAVRPTVSADRHHVRLHFQMDWTELTSEAVPLFPVQMIVTPTLDGGAQGQPVVFTQYLQQPTFQTIALDKTVCIPDGGTVVFGGLKRTTETRRECNTPVLSKVPYVNRLFKNVGCCSEEQDVLVLVTPRILLGEEDEKTAKATPPCKGAPACAKEAPKGSITLGLGINSDAGLCGSVVLSERNTDLINIAVAFDDLFSGRICQAARPAMKAVGMCHGSQEVQCAPCPAACATSTPDACCTKAQACLPPKAVGTEESEARSAKACETSCTPKDKALAEVLKAYEAACAAGRAEEAERLARAALVLDPACFSKSRK